METKVLNSNLYYRIRIYLYNTNSIVLNIQYNGVIMTKTISISVSDFVYDTYLLDFPGNNRSQYVEGLIVAGCEALTNDDTSGVRARLIGANSEIQRLLTDNNQLKARIGKLQKKEKKVGGIEWTEKTISLP